MADPLRVPQQDRSRDKLERLYEAGVALLVEGGWDAVTVGNVERRSGVSRGALYLRFPNREALLEYTRTRLVDTVTVDQDQAFARARAAGAPTLDATARAGVEAMAHVFRRHGRALLQLQRDDRETPEERGAGGAALNRLSREFRSVLEPVTGTGASYAPHLEFATELAFAMLMHMVRPRVTFPGHTERDWDAYVGDVTVAVVQYLRARIPLPE